MTETTLSRLVSAMKAEGLLWTRGVNRGAPVAVRGGKVIAVLPKSPVDAHQRYMEMKNKAVVRAILAALGDTAPAVGVMALGTESPDEIWQTAIEAILLEEVPAEGPPK